MSSRNDTRYHFRNAIDTLRRWFDPPIETGSRPLEIREAIVDRIEQVTEPAAAGRRVLPFNHVSVTVVAERAEQRAALAAVFEDLDDAVRRRLAEIRCAGPAGFEIDIQYAKRPKPGWPAEQRFSVDFETRPVTRSISAPVARQTALHVSVLRGRAAQPSYAFSEPIIRIGRSDLPTDHRGRPRQNDIAFAEDGDPHSATVGRAHASIHYDPDRGEYRLFDDGSHNGTRVVRGPVSLTVAAGNPVGVRLLSGDEIQFGTASVRIDIGNETSDAADANHGPSKTRGRSPRT